MQDDAINLIAISCKKLQFILKKCLKIYKIQISSSWLFRENIITSMKQITARINVLKNNWKKCQKFFLENFSTNFHACKIDCFIVNMIKKRKNSNNNIISNNNDKNGWYSWWYWMVDITENTIYILK